MKLRASAAAVSAALLSMSAVPANAAFFQLAENSPAMLGNANAGGAAIAEDASAVWYNPAGLARLSRAEMVIGAHAIMPSTEFNKTSATTVLTSNLTGGDGGNAGESALVPHLYYARPINSQMVFGLGINAPYGLATDYEDGWVGRYHADRSEITAININPSIAVKMNEAFSLGFGVNYQKFEATLTQAIDLGTICAVAAPGSCGALGLVPQQSDAKAEIKGDDASWGYNFGALWQASPQTRLGLAYRSSIKQKLTGNNDVTTYTAGQALFAANPLVNQVDGAVRADIELPSTLSVSAHHQLSPQWAVMGDVTRTNWSSLPELRIKFASGAADSVVTLNLEDANRYSVGATYTPGGNWSYRFGVALDKSPAPSAVDRTPRLPDEDRTWLTVGAGYKYSDRLSFDLAYVYINVEDAHINKSTAVSENTFRGNLVGDYSASVHILSGQLRWLF